MSAHNICFHEEIRKIFLLFSLSYGAMTICSKMGWGGGGLILAVTQNNYCASVR